MDSYSTGTASFFSRAIKRPGRETGHSSPCSAEDEYSYTLLPLYVFTVRTGKISPLLLCYTDGQDNCTRTINTTFLLGMPSSWDRTFYKWRTHVWTSLHGMSCSNAQSWLKHQATDAHGISFQFAHGRQWPYLNVACLVTGISSRLVFLTAVGIVARLQVGQGRKSGLLSCRDKRFLPSYKASKTAPGSTQPPFQWAARVFTGRHRNMQSKSGLYKPRATKLCTVAPNIC